MACEENCFTFIWKLENISYCLERQNRVIKSPAFVVDSIDETKWYLGLFPRGQEYDDFISFVLFRELDSKKTFRKEIKYQLTFLAKDGSCLSKTSKYDFSEYSGHGFSDFAERDEVFNTKRSIFLPQDTLTARCRIWKSDGDMTENVRCFAHTRIGVQKRSFMWNVKNLSSLPSRKILTYEIKSLTHDKQLMSVNLTLTKGSESEEIIHFKLHLHDQTIKFSTVLLSIVDASGNRIECNEEEFWFDDGSKSKEFQFGFTKDKLMAMQKSYLPDDILSLYWEWAFSEGIISEKIEDVQYACTSYENKSDTENVSNEMMMSIFSYDLNENLKSLYDENFLCDVQLKTNNRTFNAHKVILSASSPVFKAMFSNDMKEKDTSSVNIEDLNDDTISRMLHFIYTARTENLTLESASHLYIAADKYNIPSLKNICSSYLKDNLSSNNACEVLLLSNIHSDDDLKSFVQHYILENIRDTIKSDGWKFLMETNAKLAAETLCLQYEQNLEDNE